MSSTNHTENYNLPQFLGTDKPAWLSDINPAFSTIDTQIKAAATTAAQGVSDAATAQARADSAYGRAGDALTDAGTAQTTANTAIGNANAVATNLNTFMLKFNLNSISNGTLTNIVYSGTIDNNMTLAQNSDGSIFKAYGLFRIGRSSSATRVAVSGISGLYGLDTGLVLTTAPDEGYVIKSAGNESWINPDTGATQWSGSPSDIAVGNNGHIYVGLRNSAGSWAGSASYEINFNYAPCLYFNADFGDEPTPNA